jgi:epsilon-lactone hydrolase
MSQISARPDPRLSVLWNLSISSAPIEDLGSTVWLMSHAGVESVRTMIETSGMLSMSIDEQRAMLDDPASEAPAPDGVTVEAVTVGGRPAERITASAAPPDGVVLYFHGGGYCSGSIGTHRGAAGRLALASGCQVVTLDYRLAPEHPFPAAVEDATAAYRDLLAAGTSPTKMAIAGDSAGGGLTVASLLALRAEGTPLPAAAVCLSPWLDLTQSSAAYQRLGDLDPMVSKEGLDEMAAAYVGAGDPRGELISPLFAEDLSGLPPMKIEVGTAEVLLDDSVQFAERLRAAGGEVILTEWPEMIHVFQMFAGLLEPEAGQSIASVGAFISEQLRASVG